MQIRDSERETLEARIQRAERIVAWGLAAGQRIKFRESARSVIVAGCIQLVREHHAAMTQLARQRHFASLLALVRPLFEAYVWSAWVLRIATEDQLQLLAKNRFNGKLERMLRDLDGISFVGSSMLDYMKPAIRKMDGFVHGGFLHLLHRNHPGHVHPKYPDAVLIEALGMANLFTIMAILDGPLLEQDYELGDQLFAESRELLRHGVSSG